MMRKFFHKVHLWLSVPFGLFITLICFSGAMLVFEKEIMEALNPQLYYVKNVGDEMLPLDELAKKANAILPDSVQVTGMTVFSDPKRTCQVNLSRPRRSSMYIDPYTGEVTGKYQRAPFFTIMFKMHRWMMGSARAKDGSPGWGKLIIGISTLMFVFVLISGVVIWWLRNKAAWKNRFSINVRKGWRRFLYDLHVAGGIYALFFLLAIALTGLTWSFQWYRNGFYAIFGVEVPQREGYGQQSNVQERGGRKEKKNQGSPYQHWQRVYDELASHNPGFKQIAMSEGSASVFFDRCGNQLASDTYAFDSRNGEIINVFSYKETASSSKIRGWIYSVHVGSWGGPLTRILAFCAALFGASLPLTGYYLWIKRKLVDRKKSWV